MLPVDVVNIGIMFCSMTEYDKQDVLCGLPLHSIPRAGHSTAWCSRRRSRVILDSVELCKAPMAAYYAGAHRISTSIDLLGNELLSSSPNLHTRLLSSIPFHVGDLLKTCAFIPITSCMRFREVSWRARWRGIV